MRKKLPEVDELVLGTVDRVIGTSVFVKLKDYPEEGVITLSEIAPGRIRTVRDYVRPGQLIVCKVLRVDEATRHIDLSLRRVTAKEKKELLDLYKQEKEVLILLKLALKERAAQLEEPLKGEFGSLATILQLVPSEAELKTRLERAGLKPKEIEAFLALAREKVKEKEVAVKAELQLASEAPDGIVRIKQVLELAKNKVKYLGAPRYLLEVRGKNYKEANKLLEELLKGLELKARQLGCNFSFKK